MTFTKAPPSGPYTISDGVLDLGALSKTMSIGSVCTMTGGTISGSSTLTDRHQLYNVQAGTIGVILGGGLRSA